MIAATLLAARLARPDREAAPRQVRPAALEPAVPVARAVQLQVRPLQLRLDEARDRLSATRENLERVTNVQHRS